METTSPAKPNEAFVKLLSNDGVEFTAPVDLLRQSPVLAKMLEGPFAEAQKVFQAPGET